MDILCKFIFGTAVLVMASDLLAARIVNLGATGGRTYESTKLAISADGKVVVGADVRRGAFRWTAETDIEYLGRIGGTSHQYGRLGPGGAVDVSADGKYIVGSAATADGALAPFSWTREDGFTNLADLGEKSINGFPRAVSADGSTIYGRAEEANYGLGAFRWTEAAGMELLSKEPYGRDFYTAEGASKNGVIVGSTRSGTYSAQQALRWTRDTGLWQLPQIREDYNGSSRANGISADGSVIVGISSGGTPFRWSIDEGLQDLGSLGGSGAALNVSADGQVAVGYSASMRASIGEAFLWTETTGMQSIQDRLTAEGVDMSSWVLSHARDVSDDGTKIVGWGFYGIHVQAFYIDLIPEPTTASLSYAVLLFLLFGMRPQRAS